MSLYTGAWVVLVRYDATESMPGRPRRFHTSLPESVGSAWALLVTAMWSCRSSATYPHCSGRLSVLGTRPGQSGKPSFEDV